MTTALVVQILNMIQAGFNWLTSRGITKERAQGLLDTAATEGRDVTTAEVQAELDTLQAELDETGEAIENLPESE